MCYKWSFLMSERSPFPILTSSEQEISLLGVQHDGTVVTLEHTVAEALHMVMIEDTQPSNGHSGIAVLSASPGWVGDYYRQNGDRCYADNKLPLPERSLGEHLLPRSNEPHLPGMGLDGHLASLRATEIFDEKLAVAMLQLQPDLARVLINARTVDSTGRNTLGLHHAIGIDVLKGQLDDFELWEIHKMIITYIVLGTFLSGAGHYDQNGNFSLSQKLYAKSLFDPEFSSLVRMHFSEGTARIEPRTPDILLNDRANKRAVGGLAICATLAQIPALREKFAYGADVVTHPFVAGTKEEAQTMLRWYNSPDIGADGYFRNTDGNQNILQAVQFIRRQSEVFLRDVPNYASNPPVDLVEAAQDIIGFCNKMVQALQRKIPVSDLLPDIDWAAKHTAAQRSRAQRAAKGEPVPPYTDYDLTYALRVVEAVPTKDGSVKYAVNPKRSGLGYQLRDSGAFGKTVSLETARAAYHTAPPGRAALRGQMVASGAMLKGLNWPGADVVFIGQDQVPPGLPVKPGDVDDTWVYSVTMPDPRKQRFTDEELRALGL